MKLAQIWNSAKTWGVLSAMKKPPMLAYKLFKYEKLVQAEIEACDVRRQALLYEIGKAEPPAPVTLNEGTPEFVEFLSRFNDFLKTESDLTWSGITLDELIATLGVEAANAMTETDILTLEPFFTEPTVTH
jgi:hypothetical protein